MKNKKSFLVFGTVLFFGMMFVLNSNIVFSATPSWCALPASSDDANGITPAERAQCATSTSATSSSSATKIHDCGNCTNYGGANKSANVEYIGDIPNNISILCEKACGVAENIDYSNNTKACNCADGGTIYSVNLMESCSNACEDDGGSASVSLSGGATSEILTTDFPSNYMNDVLAKVGATGVINSDKAGGSVKTQGDWTVSRSSNGTAVVVNNKTGARETYVRTKDGKVIKASEASGSGTGSGTRTGAGGSVAPGALGAAGGGITVPTNTGLPDPAGGITAILKNFLNWILILAGILAVLAFVISGIRYLASPIDEKASESGKRGLKNAMIGVVVVLSAVIIIKTIELVLKGSALY